MHILLIEDNQLLSHHISSQLAEDGHTVDVESTASAGLQTLRRHQFEIAIVDIGLPDFDGIRLIKQIRRDGYGIPIMTLTARSSWQDKVEGLEAGADDYLVKPFQMEELKARLYALLRRSAGFSSQTFTVGNIHLDLIGKTIYVENDLLILTTTEYTILKCLIKHHKKIVSKQMLAEQLYKLDEASKGNNMNTIEVMISRARKKLAKAGHKNVISTIRGQGYMLNL